VNAVDAAAFHPKAVRPSTIPEGPSTTNETAKSGTGTNSADQTVTPRPPGAFAARAMTLPIPQLRAPARQSSRAVSGISPPRPVPTTASPTAATSTPRACTGVGSSRSTPAAMTIVKTTWACSTSAAMPGGRPDSIAAYTKPNWPADMKSPMPASVRQRTAGRATRKTAGTTTATNRIAANSRGGTSSRPHSMARKLTPQITATRAARRRSRLFMGSILRTPTVQHQRIDLHLIV
jgi:hypothetical protein